MGSPPHRANLLSRTFTQVGVGVVKDSTAPSGSWRCSASRPDVPRVDGDAERVRPCVRHPIGPLRSPTSAVDTTGMGRIVASRRGLARGASQLLVAAVTLVVVVPTGAQAASSSEFVADINAARTSRGGHALAVKADLNAAALAQAQRMASKSTLYHNPNLGGSVSNWTMLAENVGYGPDVATIHAAFMASAGAPHEHPQREVHRGRCRRRGARTT